MTVMGERTLPYSEKERGIYREARKGLREYHLVTQQTSLCQMLLFLKTAQNYKKRKAATHTLRLFIGE
jgi:hypothetical protein